MTYTHYEARQGFGTTGGAGRSSRISRSVRTLVARLETYFTRWTNRRAVYKLMSLDNRSLADIGITRADVEWALSQPWHVDPSDALSRCVHVRREATTWARGFNAKQQSA